jgi:Na+-driven multidrug efflux pump
MGNYHSAISNGDIGYSTFFKQKKSNKNRDELKLRIVTVKAIISIGFASFAMQLSSVVVSIISNNALKVYGGDYAIGAMTIINSIMVLFLMTAMGVTQGAAPIIGYNYGAKHFDRVKKILKLELVSVFMICTITFIVIQLFPGRLVRIFSSDPELVSKASNGIRILLLMLPVLSTQIVGASYFQAVGQPKKAILLGLSRQVLLLIPLLLILPRFFGLNGVWGANAMADLISSLIAMVALRTAFLQIDELDKRQIDSENHG